MKRWLIRGSLLLLSLLVAATLALLWYVRQSLPQTDGELNLPGLRGPVAVNRDASDVTHIMASDPRDAWMALGYVHAQERGWQLDFNRRVMRGTLSERLGPATLDTDRLMRTLGIREAAQRQVARLSPEARTALQAYSAGVNAFFAHSDQALTPEFRVLGVDPRDEARAGRYWDEADSAGWALMMALDLGGNWGTEVARLASLQVLDTAQMWQLFPPYPGEPPAASADLGRLYREWGVFRGGEEKVAQAPAAAGGMDGQLSREVVAWAQELGNVGGKGSNNWVVDGSRSQSGRPLLANDPHLGLSAPAIWYFARLQAPDVDGVGGMDVIGATLPGTPFVVLGRTAGVAWAFTNTGPDVQDLYLEQVRPGQPDQYRVPSATGQAAWAPFDTRIETIRVKGQPDVVHTVRRTRHGPVISDVPGQTRDLLDTGRYALALRWTALEDRDSNVQATLASNRAQTVGDLLRAYEGFHAPMQSVLMADRSGRIAFKAVGKVPLRQASNDIRGVAPSPGWDARYDWTGWIPWAETPQDDGSRGWIATANQRIHGPDYPYFMTQDWRPPYRHDRIVQLLQQTPRHTVESFRAIQADVHSAAALRLLPFLLRAQSRHPLAPAALATLKGFDGEMRADQAAPLVLSVWADAFTRQVIGERLGQERFERLYGKRLFRDAVEGILQRDDTFWCGEQGCAAASARALDRALEVIAAQQGRDVAAWRWGDAHPALSVHRPFGNVPMLARVFDVRRPTGGDPFTVNVGQYHPDKADAPFANRHAASLRAIYDLADLENSRFIYQTGQSGHVFSSRYRDMADEWAAVQYRPLQLNPNTWASRLTLTP
ncbi:MAG: penicillin acylase family protein [Hydrogenophaga sp.]